MELPATASIPDAKWHSDETGGEGIPTCMLHSFTKAALTALRLQEGEVDPVWVAGASGAAFRIWINKDLCPSATSIFDWFLLPFGLKAAGWDCDYHSRLWHEGNVEAERQREAHEALRRALAEGKAPICWDIGIPEWGVITGYDDAAQVFDALSVFGTSAPLKYTQLGKRDLPIMSVTIIKGRNGADKREAMMNSLHTAVRHAEQGEWEDRPNYQDGLAAYPLWADALGRLAESGGGDTDLSYYSGTYLAARHYARRYTERVAAEFASPRLESAAAAYGRVEAALKGAYGILGRQGFKGPEDLKAATAFIREAGAAETEAIGHIKGFLKEVAAA